ncbi:hypothetical protein PR202_gb07198 [Eleusine coracana subsp. coracana]|uniref:Uncharacterized protein n=1 Tax=Eleusine coracana subsp. coracana TaxID=191504 RepID=A0AAV5EC00_ELECO|nr:hypothetical protein PR202_gb07198 [Eleusine coracana subsp. coracana]
MDIGGYLVPKGATVNFMVAEMGRDEEEWYRPMEFVPERFMPGGDGVGVDMTGTKGIRMMPFGVGRRINVVYQTNYGGHSIPLSLIYRKPIDVLITPRAALCWVRIRTSAAFVWLRQSGNINK